MYYKFLSGLVGAKWGTVGNLIFDLLNKLLYRIKIKDRYKYPIPEGNVVLDMLAISRDMSKLAAGGAGAPGSGTTNVNFEVLFVTLL